MLANDGVEHGVFSIAGPVDRSLEGHAPDVGSRRRPEQCREIDTSNWLGTPARPLLFDHGIRVRDSAGIAAGALLERPLHRARVGDGAEVGGADEAGVFLQGAGEALGPLRLPGGAAAG